MTDTIKQLLRQSIDNPLDHTVLGVLADALTESGLPHAAGVGHLLSQWVTRPETRGKYDPGRLTFRFSTDWLRIPDATDQYVINHRGFLYNDHNKSPVIRHNVSLFDFDRPRGQAAQRMIISQIPVGPTTHSELPDLPNLKGIVRALRRGKTNYPEQYAKAVGG